MHKVLAIATALLFTAGLAACGEKDEPEPVAPAADAGQGAQTTTTRTTSGGGYGGGNDKKQPPIKLTVEVVLNGSSKGICSGSAATARYIRSAYGDKQGCEAAIKRLPVFDVAVSDIKVQGDTATAKAVPDGGPNKSETIRVELVREGGVWKVDSAVSNAPPGP